MRSRQSQGYTLVEMVVTVGIFALAFTTMTAIFAGFTSAQKRASAEQRLLNEATYMLESIAREIRMNQLYLCDAPQETDKVCTVRADGTYVMFKFDVGNQRIEICRNKNETACELDWMTLNPSFVTVTDASFHVFPQVSPDEPTTAEGVNHPFTLLRMTIQSGVGLTQKTLHLQTAVSSRVYSL